MDELRDRLALPSPYNPWQTAAVIDASVVRFAEAGVGPVEWVPPYYRLQAGSHEMAWTLTVLRIYRARR